MSINHFSVALESRKAAEEKINSFHRMIEKTDSSAQTASKEKVGDSRGQRFKNSDTGLHKK